MNTREYTRIQEKLDQIEKNMKELAKERDFWKKQYETLAFELKEFLIYK